MLNFFAPIDQYCERLGPGVGSEPLNLISNLSFIAVGWVLIRQANANPRLPFYRILGWQTIAVGLGSGLFHSLANYWSQLADILPIILLVVTILYFFFRNAVKLNRLKTMGALVGFLLLSVVIALVSDRASTNGSEFYFGTWISLFGMLCFYAGTGLRTSIHYTRLALAGFSSSICFRTLDERVCTYFAHGTHFMWHLCNAIVIYLVIQSFQMTQDNERT